MQKKKMCSIDKVYKGVSRDFEILGFRWSKKAKITLKAISLWLNIWGD